MLKVSRRKFVEILMNPDEFGVSDWVDIDSINDKLMKAGYRPDTGNGSTLFNSDRGLGKTYIIHKEYLDGSVHVVKLAGLKEQVNLNIPDAVRQHFKGDACVVCGTTHQIEIDHKDGRKTDDVEGIEDFQAMCKHCNDRKREVCKKCKETGERFDATTLGFKNPVSAYHCLYEGTCEGCFWFDPIVFRFRL